jgi:hypothetical protein
VSGVRQVGLYAAVIIGAPTCTAIGMAVIMVVIIVFLLFFLLLTLAIVWGTA